MCKEDIRIGARCTFRRSGANVNSIPADKRRIRLVVSGGANGAAPSVINAYASDVVNVATQFAQFTGFGIPTVMRIEDYGDLIQQAVTFENTGGPEFVFVLEVLSPEELTSQPPY